MIAILHEIEQCGVEQVALLGKDSGTEHNFREAIKRATNLRNKQVSFIDTDQGQNFEAKAIGKCRVPSRFGGRNSNYRDILEAFEEISVGANELQVV